jgi:transcriptional regulator GlxA family with amidase domain
VEGLKKSNPEVNWTTKRWERDGKLWTSGALLNGTDLMAAFVTEYWGKGDAGNYAEFGLRLGAWPRRERGYGDVEWEL